MPTTTNDAISAANEAAKKMTSKGTVTAAPEVEVPQYRPGEFDSDFLSLYQNEPFLGAVSMEVTKIIDDLMPTAYVGVRPSGNLNEIVLGINSAFFRSLMKKHRQGVLKHELYHMIFQHIFVRSIGEKSYAVLWNWATDLAINSIIGAENLPELALFPGRAPTDPKTGKPIEGPYAEYIASAPPMQSADYYFEALRKIQDEQGDGDGEVALASGIGTLDDHDGWKNMPKEVQEEVKDKVRDLMEKGVLRADRDNSWGSVPSEIQDVIRKMVSNEVDWRSIVRNFVGRCRTMLRNSSIRKINKKLPYLFPGTKRPLRANFVTFLDQSGSMSDDDIALLYSELENLAKETEIDVYHFDTSIDATSHMKWKQGRPLPKIKRTRCGGTDFQCVANFCNKPENRGKWSGVIILTDGYAARMGAITGARVLWVITETGTMTAVRSGDLAVQMKKEKQFKSY